MKQETGFTVIEFLIAALVGSLLLVPLAFLLHTHTRALRQAEAQFNLHTNRLRVRRLGFQIFAELQTHTLPLYPRVHPPGSLTLTDGTPLIFNNRALLPHSSSQSITSVHIDPREILRLTPQTNSDFESQFKACTLSTYEDGLKEAEYFLGFNREHIYELRSEIPTFLPKPGACTTLTLQPTGSMITTPPSKNFSSIRFALPIHALYTIYVDSSDTLRWLGTEGDQVVENQPIREDALPLKINIQRANSESPLVIDISLYSQNNKIVPTFIQADQFIRAPLHHTYFAWRRYAQ